MIGWIILRACDDGGLCGRAFSQFGVWAGAVEPVEAGGRHVGQEVRAEAVGNINA